MIEATTSHQFGDYFMRARTAMPRDLAAFLSGYDRRDPANMGGIIAHGGLAGGALRRAADGVIEAVNLYNIGAPRGTGAEILRRLAAAGARRLDCLGDGLRDHYARHGWAVVETHPWDDRLAPIDWDYARRGRPNLYVMELTSDLTRG